MQDVGDLNFTPTAHQALVIAKDEALLARHNFVGTEHVLFGIIAVQDPVVRDLLELTKKSRFDLVRMIAEKLPVSRVAPESPAPFTPRVKKVLSWAAKAAVDHRQRKVGIEHMIYGLVKEGQGNAAKVLGNIGFTEEKAQSLIELTIAGNTIA